MAKPKRGGRMSKMSEITVIDNNYNKRPLANYLHELENRIEEIENRLKEEQGIE